MSAQVADAELVQLVAAEIDRVGKQVLVRAPLHKTQVEVLMTVRQDIPVELDFLGGIH